MKVFNGAIFVPGVRARSLQTAEMPRPLLYTINTALGSYQPTGWHYLCGVTSSQEV